MSVLYNPLHFNLNYLQNKCRVCLTFENNMKSVFKDTQIDGNKVPISYILSYCGNIQVSRNDDKPGFICRKCLENGKICYSFRNIAKDNDTKLNVEILLLQESILKSTLHVGATTSNKISENSNQGNNEVSTEEYVYQTSDNDTMDFENENYSFIKAEEAYIDENVVIEINNEPGELFSETLQDSNLDDVTVKIEPKTEPDFETLLHCRRCVTFFNDQLDFDKHIQRNDCIKEETNVFRTKEKRGKYLYNCQYCEETFNKKKLYQAHRKEHIENGDEKRGTAQCKYCDFVPKNKNNLWRHVDEHHSQFKNISCPVCDMKFFYQRTLKSHMMVHGGQRKYVCDFCGKLFLRSSSLVAHRRIHTGEKPFKCDVCGLLFGQYNSLKSHKFSHTDKYDYICDVCGMKFKRLHDFQRHSRRHLDVKPYPCKYCNKSFTSNYDLKMHSQVHSNSRKFNCEKCGKGFLRRWNLSLHLRRCTSKLSNDNECDKESS